MTKTAKRKRQCKYTSITVNASYRCTARTDRKDGFCHFHAEQERFLRSEDYQNSKNRDNH